MVGVAARRGRPVGDRPALGRRHRDRRPARAVERPHPGARVRRRRVDGVRTAPCGSPSSPTSGCTGSTPAATRRSRSPRSRRCRPASGTPTCASVPDGAARRPGDPRRGRPARRRRQRDRPASARRLARCWSSGPDFVSDPRLAPGRRDAVVAAVGPPEHAVGRRPAGRPRRRRHRARASPAARASPSSSPSGATTSRCGSSATAPTSGRCTASGRTSEPELVVDVGSDIAGPQWVFGQSRFALLADGRVAFAYGRDGADRLAVLEADGSIRELDVPFGVFRCLTAQGTRGGLRRRPARPASPSSCGSTSTAGQPEILRPARDLGLDPAWFSRPEHVTFPTEDRGTGIAVAHALVYPPTNPEVAAPGRRPAAADGRGARRPDGRRRPGAQPRGPVLDVARVLRRRRRLPRLDRLRPPLPGRAAGPLGHRSTSTTSSPAPATSPTAAGSTRPGWRSAAARPAGTRRWPR